MYDVRKEIENLSEDLDNAGYIADVEKDDPLYDILINNEDRIAHMLENFAFDDVYDWIRSNIDENGENMVEMNSLYQRLNVLQFFCADMGIMLFDYLVGILPDIDIDSDTISSNGEDRICVRTRAEAETVRKIFESVSKASRFNTCFGVNYHDLEQDRKNNAKDQYTGWYTIEISERSEQA